MNGTTTQHIREARMDYDLALKKYLDKLDDRAITWLAFLINSNNEEASRRGIKPNGSDWQAPIQGTNQREQIFHMCKDIPEFVSITEQLRGEQMLSRGDLAWITSADDRLCNWLIWTFSRHPQSPFLLHPAPPVPNQALTNSYGMQTALPPHSYQQIYTKANIVPPAEGPRPGGLKRREIINTLDCWFTKNDEKNRYLQELMKRWSNIRRFDKHLRWIERKDQDQCRWAWSYLESKGMAHLILCPSSNYDFFFAVMTSFDVMPYMEIYKEKQATSMKNAWNKRLRRSGENGLTQINFELNSRQREKLEVVAAQRGLSSGKTLTALIEADYARLVERGLI